MHFARNKLSQESSCTTNFLELLILKRKVVELWLIKKSWNIFRLCKCPSENLVNLVYVPLLLSFLGQGDYGVFQMTNSVVFALTLLSAGFMAVMFAFICVSGLQVALTPVQVYAD